MICAVAKLLYAVTALLKLCLTLWVSQIYLFNFVLPQFYCDPDCRSGQSGDFLVSKIDKRGVTRRQAGPQTVCASAEQAEQAEQRTPQNFCSGGTGSVDRAKASAEPAERQQAERPAGTQVFLEINVE